MMRLLISFLISFALSSIVSAQNASTSTGFLMQHGFERVLVQPYPVPSWIFSQLIWKYDSGFDGFRVRAWAYKPPTGNEISFLYDPPLEGPENGVAHGLTFDTTINGTVAFSMQNGNIIVNTVPGNARGDVHLQFFRQETNDARYYDWPTTGSEFATEFSFSTTPDEQIYGTGTQVDHMVNKKGQVIDMINFNSYIPTPVFMSSKGYGFVWNSASEGKMEFGTLRNRFTSDSTTLVDYAIVAVPEGEYDLLQQRLTAMAGRAPTPPDFSLGYIQSKNRYHNQTEIMLLAENFVKFDIPVSMIVIDFLSWAHQGDWALDPTLWPDPAAMSAQVMNLTGAEMMASLWPSVEDLSVNYMTLSTLGYLASSRSGPGVIDQFNGVYVRNYDPTNPDARQFFADSAIKNYYDNGIKNIWIDQGDGGNLGEAWENVGQVPYINSIPYPLPDVQYHAGTQKSVGKLFPWAHQQGIEEGLRNATGTAQGSACPQLSLSRSGYIGSQRFCSMIWSGDTYSTWEGLGQQVASGLSAASTGWGWWTLDIGGFQKDPGVGGSGNIDSIPYQEVYVRWQQWATFLPFMRNHGQRECNTLDAFTCDNEPWSYGATNTPIIASYINLRYSLIPYIKALFAQLAASGRMIMRPLFMDFSMTDPNITKMTFSNNNITTQQYMFGPRLLVTPITMPGATNWTVYLPQTAAGANTTANGTSKPWTYWWTNVTYAGGQSVVVPTPIEHIPVFFLGSRADIMSGKVF